MDPETTASGDDSPVWPTISADISSARSAARSITLDTRRAGADGRFLSLESRFDSVGTRLLDLEKKVLDERAAEGVADELVSQFLELRAAVSETTSRFDSLVARIAANDEERATSLMQTMDGFDTRIDSVETIVARVGEGIVSAIGSAGDHKAVLENPDMISKAVLARRLDSQTAFEIVSIDIADIDVGQNIGARLQADKAEADTRVARARAEGRRAMAVAAEQEQMAGIEESRAQLVEAEAEVPKAMAAAFHGGQLGIMDYYKLRNVQADTDMRQSIALAGHGSEKK